MRPELVTDQVPPTKDEQGHEETEEMEIVNDAISYMRDNLPMGALEPAEQQQLASAMATVMGIVEPRAKAREDAENEALRARGHTIEPHPYAAERLRGELEVDLWWPIIEKLKGPAYRS